MKLIWILGCFREVAESNVDGSDLVPINYEL